jgi:hypothetical protein
MAAPPGFNATASLLPDPGASSAPIEVMRGGGQVGGFGAQEIETLKKYGLYETGIIAKDFNDDQKRAFLTELESCNWGSGNAVITNGRCQTVANVLKKLLSKKIRKANDKQIPLRILGNEDARFRHDQIIVRRLEELVAVQTKARQALEAESRKENPNTEKMERLRNTVRRLGDEISNLYDLIHPTNFNEPLNELAGVPELGPNVNPFAPKPKAPAGVVEPEPSASLAEAYATTSSASNIFEPRPKRLRPGAPKSEAPVGMSGPSRVPGAGAHAYDDPRFTRRPTGLNAILTRGRARRSAGQTFDVRNIEYTNGNTTNLGRIKPNMEEVELSTVKYEIDPAVAKATQVEKNPASAFNCSKPSNSLNTFGYNTRKNKLFKNFNTNTGKLRVYGTSAKNIKTRGAYEKQRARTQKARTNTLAQQQQRNANLLKSKQAFELKAQKETKASVINRMERELAQFKRNAPPAEPAKKPGLYSRAKSWFKRGGKRKTRRNRK